MILGISKFIYNLFDFLFSGLTSLIDLVGSAVSFLLKAAASAFSALGNIFLAPFRLGSSVADVFGIPVLWTPLFLLGCAVLLLLLLALTGWALAANAKRKHR